MNQLTVQQQGQGFCLASVGNLNGFEGKAFVKEVMNTTGMEVSFGSLAPGQAVPFNHRHKQNEELYIVLQGEGVFTLDGQEFPVASGSLVKVEIALAKGKKLYDKREDAAKKDAKRQIDRAMKGR